jgi:hypothetical protein
MHPNTWSNLRLSGLDHRVASDVSMTLSRRQHTTLPSSETSLFKNGVIIKTMATESCGTRRYGILAGEPASLTSLFFLFVSSVSALAMNEYTTQTTFGLLLGGYSLSSFHEPCTVYQLVRTRQKTYYERLWHAGTGGPIAVLTWSTCRLTRDRPT